MGVAAKLNGRLRSSVVIAAIVNDDDTCKCSLTNDSNSYMCLCRHRVIMQQTEMTVSRTLR